MGKWDKYTKREKRLMTCECGYECMRSSDMQEHLELNEHESEKHRYVQKSRIAFLWFRDTDKYVTLALLYSTFIVGMVLGVLLR